MEGTYKKWEKEEPLCLVAQLVKKSVYNAGDPSSYSWVRKIPWRRDRLPTPVLFVFSGVSDSKESACNVGDLGSISGLRRSSGREHGNPLQYSCLENPHGQRSLSVYSQWGREELAQLSN